MAHGSKSSILIGTSGWSYEHWKGTFYPNHTTNEQMLQYYVQHFHTVELNNTFYHLPLISTFEHWRDAVPKRFVFAVKASRYITHMKKLKDPQKSISELMHRIGALGDKLGPVLFQLPPKWRFNAERLDVFLRSLSRDFRYAFEFRDHTWINQHTFDLLARHNAAFCIYEFDGYLSPRIVTSDFIYIRLHGPNGPYQGSYSDAALSKWATAINGWKKQAYRVFCYFDNDQAGYAADNAKSLCARLGLVK
jgi:uncharacterized protein YecE (DUF72 family)